MPFRSLFRDRPFSSTARFTSPSFRFTEIALFAAASIVIPLPAVYLVSTALTVYSNPLSVSFLSSVTFSPATNVVCLPASALTLFNWLTFTASVSAVPSATPVILPLLSMVTLLLSLIPPSAKLMLPAPAPVMDSIPVRAVFSDRPLLSTTRFFSPSFSLTLIFLSVIEIPLPSVRVTPAILSSTNFTLVTEVLSPSLTSVTYALLVVTLVRPFRFLFKLTAITPSPLVVTLVLSPLIKFTLLSALGLTSVPLACAVQFLSPL